MKLSRNQQGFTIIEVTASLVILTISVLSLMYVSTYAYRKAEENYHYRAALLQLAGQMERVKCLYDMSGQIYGPVERQLDIDDTYLPVLKGNLDITTSRKNDLQIGNTIVYDQVEMTLTWKEKLASPDNYHDDGEPRSITLREDYYRRVQVGAGAVQ